MRTSSRRQVRTPVGNKTKRGAELEGTPKTPKSLEASPAKSTCTMDAEDDRRLPLRTKRPLQWSNLLPQRIDIDPRGENTMSPCQQAPMKGNWESNSVAALSPICVNAINGNEGQQGAEKKPCLKYTKKMPSAIMSPSLKTSNGSPDRRCLGKAKALNPSIQLQDEVGEASADEGSCPSSSEIPSRGKHVLFWSNAAFNTHEPCHNESVDLNKGATHLSISSAASSSQSLENAALGDSEAESVRLELKGVCNGDLLGLSTVRKDLAQTAIHSEIGLAGHNDVREDSSPSVKQFSAQMHCSFQEKEALSDDCSPERICAIVPGTVTAVDHTQMLSKSKIIAAESENLEQENADACKDDVFDRGFLTNGEHLAEACHMSLPSFASPSIKEAQEFTNRSLDADNDDKLLNATEACLPDTNDNGFPPFGSPSMKGIQEEMRRSLEAADGAQNDEESLKGGLHEIQQEIERLTERLAELHLQKRKRVEELRRQKGAKEDNLTAELSLDVEKARETKRRAGAGACGRAKESDNGSVDCRSPLVRERSELFMDVEKARETKRRAGAGACGRAKESDGGRSPIVRDRPWGAAVASKSREETPQVSSGRLAKASAAASVSKLSAMRRSVSSTGRRTERYNSEEHMKALRRLSLSGTRTGSDERKLQQPQQSMSKPMPAKGTPSRVVSSRFGRAITPEACRPSAPAGYTPPQKRDRVRPSSSSASSSLLSLPAQPQPHPSPSASIQCSPLGRSATVRSGYPSRSGFSTPSKDRHALVKPSSFVSSSVQLPLPKLSPITKPKDRNCLLLSLPRCMSPLPRLDSPKSTAALYKCLELLLEDSKHFFKRLSPVRRQLQENAIGRSAAASPKQLLATMENALPAINTCRLEAMSPRDSGCVKRASDRLRKRFYFAPEDENPPPREATMSAAGIMST